MNYKYTEADVEGAKELAKVYKELPRYQEIYEERLTVLNKAKAFDQIEKLVVNKPDSEILKSIKHEIEKMEGKQ
ncbi:hypothetical protein WMA08_02270 [Staphylococcus simulans]|uniref:hypothetical protein n=1 Tax=Staphylococcus simulans TaxID=1286 RepID=UPI0030C0CE3C